MDFSLALVLLGFVGVILVGLLVVGVIFLVKLIKLHRVVTDPRMPRAGTTAFWAALCYAVFPIDLLPDPIYLDDIGVLIAAISYIGGLARKSGIGTDRIVTGEIVQPPERPTRSGRPE